MAAGQGTRMLELTKDRPKHMIEVQNKPFLFYLLDNLFSAGYNDIILVLGFKAELVESFVKNYTPPSAGNFKIEFKDQYKILGPKEKEYGTACPIKCAKDFVKNDNFVKNIVKIINRLF